MNDGGANDIDICEWRIIVRVPLVSLGRRRRADDLLIHEGVHLAAGDAGIRSVGDETKDLAHDVEHRPQLHFAEPPERVGRALRARQSKDLIWWQST